MLLWPVKASMRWLIRRRGQLWSIDQRCTTDKNSYLNSKSISSLILAHAPILSYYKEELTSMRVSHAKPLLQNDRVSGAGLTRLILHLSDLNPDQEQLGPLWSCAYQKWELDSGTVELLVGLQSQAEHPAEDALDEVGEDGDVAADGEAPPRSAVDSNKRRLKFILIN